MFLMTYYRGMPHEHLTLWINKTHKLNKSPCHSNWFPSVSPCLLGSEVLSVLLRNEKRLVSALRALDEPLCRPPLLLHSTPLIIWCRQKPSPLLWSLIPAPPWSPTTLPCFLLFPSSSFLAFIEVTGAWAKWGLRDEGFAKQEVSNARLEVAEEGGRASRHYKLS